MRRAFLGLLTGLALFPAASWAQDASSRACDLAAASPDDLTRPANVPGIEIDRIDPKIALPACNAALAAAPNNARLLFEMARVLQASKDDSQAREFYEK